MTKLHGAVHALAACPCHLTLEQQLTTRKSALSTRQHPQVPALTKRTTKLTKNTNYYNRGWDIYSTALLKFKPFWIPKSSKIITAVLATAKDTERIATKPHTAANVHPTSNVSVDVPATPLTQRNQNPMICTTQHIKVVMNVEACQQRTAPNRLAQ